MTYFDKFLMQGLSKYYKNNYHDLKRFFWKLFHKFSKIFLKYFPKSSHKSNKKTSGCGSCYPICTHET